MKYLIPIHANRCLKRTRAVWLCTNLPAGCAGDVEDLIVFRLQFLTTAEQFSEEWRGPHFQDVSRLSLKRPLSQPQGSVISNWTEVLEPLTV